MWFDENGMPTPYPPKSWPNINEPEAPLEPLPNPDPTNQKFLGEAYGINTRGPMADQAASNAQDFNAAENATIPGSGQHMPQQFGTPETGDRDGVLTPQETAEAMPSTSKAMDDLIKKHMLHIPKAPTVSSDGRQNDLTAKREAEAAEKEQRALRGDANRARTREKSADAWTKTLALNALQGAGPWAMGGRGGMGSPGMGSPVSDGGRVQRIGGYAFVSGRMRPMGDDELAKTRLTNANADYISQRPDLQREGYNVRASEGAANRENKLETTGMRTDASKENTQARVGAARDIAGSKLDQNAEQFGVKQANVIDKRAEALRREFDGLVAQLREREGIAEEQVKAGQPGWIRSMLGGKAPDWKTFLDDTRNKGAKPGQPQFTRSAGSYDTMAGRALMLAKQLEDLHGTGASVGEIPDDVIDYIQSLRQMYPSN